ncbi:MAG: hypothetical protein AB1638_03805, partial [Nitrospirota bacterium]
YLYCFFSKLLRVPSLRYTLHLDTSVFGLFYLTLVSTFSILYQFEGYSIIRSTDHVKYINPGTATACFAGIQMG